MSRPERRRQARRAGKGARDVPPSGLFRRREVIGVFLLAATVAAIVAGLALLGGGGGKEDSASETPRAVFSPSTPDEAAIEALARRSIEVLPQGEWPSLYDEFTDDFQARCPREQFDQGGETNAAQLGTNLPLLGYKRLEEVAVTGDTATVVIVGELRGQSEYRIRAAFQRVTGAWKLAPAEGTAGCEAFTRLSA